jgi:hypothetical protein
VAVPAPTQGFASPSLIATQTPKAIASANTVMVLVATATLTRISRSHLGSSSLRRTVELICEPVVCPDGSWHVADMLSNSHRTMLSAVAAPAAAPTGPATAAPKTPPTAAPLTRFPVVVQAAFPAPSAIIMTTALFFMNPRSASTQPSSTN